MKKLILTSLGLFSLVARASAQGTFTIDSGANFGDGSTPYATTGGLVWVWNTSPVVETSDINIGLLWGTSPTTVTTQFNLDPDGLNSTPNPNWLASQPTGMGDMTSYGGGAIFDPNGNAYVVPGEVAGTTIWLVLQGWAGNAPSYTTSTSFSGETAPFAVTLAVNTSPIQPTTANMGALVLSTIPEPSLPSLCSACAVALTFFRRRK
jgi:hypothetical protein